MAPQEGPARRFVEAHHYSGSWPAVSMALGLHRVDEEPGLGASTDGRLYGVLTLGVPMNAAVLTRVFPALAVSAHRPKASTHR